MSDYSLAEMILGAARSDGLAEEMSAFYRRVDAAVAAHRPTCRNQGLCCKFGQAGHRLFVTSVEAAYFHRGHVGEWLVGGDENACPWQVGGLCTAREDRPLGCRIYFCDPDAQGWQSPEYEGFMGELKAIGARNGVEYRYAEWLSVLRALSGAAQGKQSRGDED